MSSETNRKLKPLRKALKSLREKETSKTSDRFITPCELPTDYEREVLTILMEECAEVIQRASKAIRFGLAEIQPEQPFSNSTRLALEIGDVLAVIELCQEAEMISTYMPIQRMSVKRGKLKKYMQFSKPEDI